MISFDIPSPNAHIIAAAEDYVHHGLSVIPIHGVGGVSDRKLPAIPSWKQYQEYLPKDEELEEWFGGIQRRNVGIVTGSISKLIAVDLDGPNAMALIKAAGIEFPRTASIMTGRGQHILFRYAGKIETRARIFDDSRGSGVDVRAEGGYIVAPPSYHGSGTLYQWTVPLDELADLPVELEDLLTHKDAVALIDKDPDWYDKILGGVDEGERHDTLCRVAGYWSSITKADISSTMRAVKTWARLCTPPISATEVERVVTDMVRKDIVSSQAALSKSLPRLQVLSGDSLSRLLETESPETGIPIDHPGIQELGGLVEGRLVVLCGRPGTGKSSWASQLIAKACIDRHIPTIMFSMEMRTSEICRWIAANRLRQSVDSLPMPMDKSMARMFGESPFSISDNSLVKAGDLRTITERFMGVKLVIVDNLTTLVSDRKHESRTLDIGECVRGLKALAKDLKCTVVLLTHMNRAIDKEKRAPVLADLRESAEIEQGADSVSFLWTMQQPDKEKEIIKLHLSCEKNRHGKCYDLNVVFNRPLVSFDYGG